MIRVKVDQIEVDKVDGVISIWPLFLLYRNQDEFFLYRFLLFLDTRELLPVTLLDGQLCMVGFAKLSLTQPAAVDFVMLVPL